MSARILHWGAFVAGPGRSYSFEDDGTVTVRVRIPIGS